MTATSMLGQDSRPSCSANDTSTSWIWSILPMRLRAWERLTSAKSENRLETIIAHLLKWKYQPGRRGASWRDTIVEQRSMLAEIVIDSPSLAEYVREAAVKKYRAGRLTAARQTGLSPRIFPATCPFTVDEILDPDFFPEDPENE